MYNGAITAPTDSRDPIASRYLPEGVLGRGGAGQVFRARDTASGKVVALKRLTLRQSDPKQAELALLFEREYHTLAQLAHPNIVEVYDYGVDDGHPYYTMELLDGSDLRELAPLPWQRACALLCDVASSLALLHSRRLVHRDLTPRNVRCTSDGRTKLLDFGALAPMGIARHIVGTPGYIAPEQANGQELDARADLYGFGALAYWTLTGREAFRARTFKDLVDVWRTRPITPSAIVPDLPLELDALVMSLLSFDPTARPVSAAEVMRRLRALCNLPADETSETAQAYLATPALVARADQQRILRKLMLAGVRGQGASVLIEGGAGMGRSRLLASAVLEAKLAGALVLSASGSDAVAEDFRVLRELVDSLLEAAPQLAQKTAVKYARALAAAFPALGFPAVHAAPDAEALEALVAWFEDMAGVQALCIAVDDLPRVDVPSAAFFARLAAHAKRRKIVVAATAEIPIPASLARAVDQFTHSSARIVLTPLVPQETEALLRSVFGAVLNLQTIAGWIHGVSAGKPAACLELAQHLVDQGIARFADGAWTLPHTLDGLSLPSSFEQALELRYAALTAGARALTQLLSLVSPLAPLKLADYLELLSPPLSHRQVFLALDELMRAQLLAQTGESHVLRDGIVHRMVDASIDAETRRALHARLARHHEQRGSIEMLVAHHWLNAGEWRRAFDIHEGLRPRLIDIASANALFDRSELGVACLEGLYRAAIEQGLSPEQLYGLRKHLIQLAAVCDPTLDRYADELLAQLRQESGLVYWDERPELPALERVMHCIAQAQQRYDHTPESQRGLAPIHAIRELAVVVGIMTGVCSRTVDVERVSQLSQLITPFAPLSPVIDLLREMVDNSAEAMIHATDVRERRQYVIDQLSKPIDGLDELTRQGARLVLTFYQGLDYAVRLDARALTCAELLDSVGNYAPLASQVRVVYYQCNGELRAAAHAAEERDSRALLTPDADTHLTPSLFYEASRMLTTGDLVGGKKMVEIAAREASRFAGWKPWHAYTIAAFEALRGDSAAALAAIDECHRLAPDVGHAAGVMATILKIELLGHVGRHAEAHAIGRELLARCEAEGRVINGLTPFPLAMAYAETLNGDYQHGAARLDAVISELEGAGADGLLLGVVYTERARIALIAGDSAAFEHFAALATAINERLRHPGLVGRLQTLVRTARNADQPISPELARGAELTVMTTSAPVAAIAHLGQLSGQAQPAERTQHALSLLIRTAHAAGGYLFGATATGLRLLASIDVPAPDEVLEQAAAALIAAANADDDLVTRIEEPRAAGRQSESITTSELVHEGYVLQPFLLRSAWGQRTALGLALLVAHRGRRPFLHDSVATTICDGLVRAGDLASAEATRH